MIEHKEWEQLKLLFFDNTGLIDISLDYFSKDIMPKLEKLYFRGNKFTDNAKQSINVLRKNHIHVIVILKMKENLKIYIRYL